MKVCVISPFIVGKPHLTKSPASKYDILNFIESICCFYDFIVLAGYDANHYPNEIEVQNRLKLKQSFAIVFIETGGMQSQNHSPSDKAFFVSANAMKVMPEQIFSKTKKQKITRNDVLALQQNLPRRFHTISNKNVLLFICGEIDAFTIHNNAVHHNVSLNWQHADLIINPTFTIRGRWNTLGIKLSNLSLNKKIVIHNANNQKKHDKKSKIIANIKVFFDDGECNIDRYVDIKYNLTWSLSTTV